MIDRIYCKNCDEGITFDASANYMIFCPNCFDFIKLVYDFDSDSPSSCDIYLGRRRIGEVNCDSKGYYLKSPFLSFFAIRLKENGVEALYEAKDIIKKRFGERMRSEALASSEG